MQFSIKLAAGVPSVQETRGAYFLLLDTGAADSIAVGLRLNSQTMERVDTATRGFKARMAAGTFDRVELASSVDTVVQAIISDGAVDINTVEGSSVIVSGLPQGDGPGNPLFVSGITYDDTPATAVNESGAVAVTAALTPLLAANVNRKGFRVINMDPVNNVAIGGASLTYANAVIVLGPGIGWEERDAATVAWKARCDTGDTATLNVQELML